MSKNWRRAICSRKHTWKVSCHAYYYKLMVANTAVANYVSRVMTFKNTTSSE